MPRSVIVGFTNTDRHANVLDQLLHVGRRLFGYRRHREGHNEVHQCTYRAECVGLDAEEPVLFHVTQEGGAGNKHDALVLEHVEQGHADTGNHAHNGALFVDAWAEDTHHQRGED